jgi:multidrug resistance protein, MATE family
VAFNTTGLTPTALQGAPGLWAAATAGLTLAGVGMCTFLSAMLKRQRRLADSA